MFQSYSDKAQKHHIPERLAALRVAMQEQGITAFIVPRVDAHQGEYVAAKDERLSYITGFTGSAGMALIMLETAILFVDGRYTLQAAEQTDPALFEILEIPQHSLKDTLKTRLQPNDNLAFDPWLATSAQAASYQAVCDANSAKLLAVEHNLIDGIWHDQPSAPTAPLLAYPEALSGESAAAKLERLQAQIIQAGADAHLTSLPDEIAWAFNLRGSDIPHTPVALGFALIPAQGKAQLFFPANKADDLIIKALEPVAEFQTVDHLQTSLKSLGGQKVLLDEATLPHALAESLRRANASLINGSPAPITALKACKNATELQGFRAAHARDGVAVVRFLNWLEQNVHQGAVTEISAAQKLESLRMDTGQLKDISFDTISGAGANGAIVHYKVSEASNRPLRPNEIYLVDSGAQYEDGTTDITRTLCIGTPSLEMKRCYTLVLKGHIALSRAQFPIGTSGAQLDILARQPLWSHGLDYAHGTGHGVGHYLSVHEGPVSISKRSSLPLQVGMVLSNEPGYYKAGAFGIRIENLISVKPVEDNEGWLGFETLTLAPYARNLIAPMLLDQSELDWINAYHARVENVIGPMLQSPSDRQWLQQQTMPL